MTQTTNFVHSDDEIGIKILAILGLQDQHVERLEIVLQAGKPVTVNCHTVAYDAGALEGVAREVAHYQLVKQ